MTEIISLVSFSGLATMIKQESTVHLTKPILIVIELVYPKKKTLETKKYSSF